MAIGFIVAVHTHIKETTVTGQCPIKVVLTNKVNGKRLEEENIGFKVVGNNLKKNIQA
jgi:hypothetical protein